MLDVSIKITAVPYYVVVVFLFVWITLTCLLVTGTLIRYDTFNRSKYYLFIVNNRNTRKSCEKWSKLTIKIPERRLFLNSLNSENISQFFLAFLSLTWNR